MFALAISKSPEICHKFFKDVFLFAERHKINIVLIDKNGVGCNGIEASGLFDAETETMSIGIDKPFEEWFPTFIHEYNHARQYADGFFEIYTDLSGDLFEWIEDEEFDDEELDSMVANAIMLESDCEYRTVGMISKYGFESIIPQLEYGRKSNAYVQFYQYVRKYRKWYEMDIAPYRNISVYSLFPEEVVIGKMSLTDDQFKAFERCVK
jgi:hypothetical protein